LAKLARTYRNVRSQQGSLSACVAVNRQLRSAANKRIDGLNDMHIASTLISSEGMAVLGDVIGVVPRAWYQAWSFNICDAVSALNNELANAHPQTLTEMSNWLVQHGIQWKDVKQGDLDGDGQPDWLVIIPAVRDIYSPADTFEVWGILQRLQGLTPVYIGDFSDAKTGPSPMNWKTIKPDASSQIQNAVRVGNNLYVFRIEEAGDGPIVRHLLYVNWTGPGWKSLSAVSSFSTLSGNDAGIVLLRDTSVCDVGCSLHETYRWDARLERWLLASSDPQLQSERLRAVETQLFGQQDYRGAIAVIQSWLKEGVSDPVAYGYPPPKPNAYVSSYLRYLLGLAYEQSGQPELAVQIYYELWKENRNVFGYLASQRLQPK
jgi:hypothetical protein